ncbi:hypothetical protein CLV98_108149 [Dyadobacter jejuensis]|uniref:Uncharacterized protein n=1 Tax=Dyadobacter jejuensis TaxID=1082580 RepID=A0A316AJ13_9BACT|nr:hypothetical protein [Dyadobacter jejuensis]PWJ57229.1 hypothetical protein CLV98_108149 [Dyadobacter jejuensis]
MTQVLEKCIEQIESSQCVGHPHFVDGTFPAYRQNARLGYKRPDATLFFAAIICFSLQEMEPELPAELANRVKSLCARIRLSYPNFQNKDGLNTYNFWTTRPSHHFPNGRLFHRFRHFKIPDDVDDTAFVYMTTPRTAQDYSWLQQKLSQHANGTKQFIQNTFSDCRELPAYSTWFGDKMYIEFDACALSNLLYCLLRAGVVPDRHATASLEYLRTIIETDRYITDPFHCAHHYPKTSLIVYHISRLIGRFHPEVLRPVQEKLIQDTHRLVAQAKHPLERVVLSIALLRLGECPPELPASFYQKEAFGDFSFFIAGLLTAYENPALYRLAPFPLFHMNWVCEAHGWALLAEYEFLKQRAKK